MAPASGKPPNITPTEQAYSGMPRTKLRVPSIGSMTQQTRWLLGGGGSTGPKAGRLSSVMKASSGRAARISRTIAAWAASSASSDLAAVGFQPDGEIRGAGRTAGRSGRRGGRPPRRGGAGRVGCPGAAGRRRPPVRVLHRAKRRPSAPLLAFLELVGFGQVVGPALQLPCLGCEVFEEPAQRSGAPSAGAVLPRRGAVAPARSGAGSAATRRSRPRCWPSSRGSGRRAACRA